MQGTACPPGSTGQHLKHALVDLYVEGQKVTADISGETDDLVTRKADELRLGAEPGKDGVHPCKIGLLRFPRHSGAAVRIADELMAGSVARGEGSDRGRK